MLSKGQFRFLQYTDDGCSLFECLWCKKQVEIRDNPNYWCFCPHCGKSWFNRLECRGRDVPAWYYNKLLPLGEDAVVRTTTQECEVCSLKWHSRPLPKKRWVIESRYTWDRVDNWSEWSYEYSIDKHPYESDYKMAYQHMQIARAIAESQKNEDEFGWQFHFRLTLRDK